MKTIEKDDLTKIESFFDTLKDGFNKDKINDVISILSKIFNKSFTIGFVSEEDSNHSFVMSVTPDDKTIKDVSKKIIDGKEDSSGISSVWKKCKTWHVSIDSRMLDSSFTSRELTSLLLHEIYHIVESDDAPKRIFDTLQYTLSCNNCDVKALAKKPEFGSILQLPIIQACYYANSIIDIKKEIKSNECLKGNISYTDAFISCMNKIEAKGIGVNNLNKTSDFSISTLVDLKNKNIEGVKENLTSFIDELPKCEKMKTCCESVVHSMFDDYYKNTITESAAIKNMEKDIDSILETSYVKEFLGLGKEKLVPITQNQIDYVLAKSESIESVDDKVMLLSYINSKLDMIRYYIEIINNPKMAKKYIIPNSESQLIRFNNQLIQIKKYILNYKIPEKRNELVTWYPTGYEG